MPINVELWGPFDYGIDSAIESLLPLIEENSIGVEIGVWRGDSSRYLLKKCKFMYFIDPFKRYSDYLDSNIISEEDNAMVNEFTTRMNYLKPNGYRFIQNFSHLVLDEIPMVDFVFIDGNHGYEYVKMDLELYWEKIKVGGLLCGHDYIYTQSGVFQAVKEFEEKVKVPATKVGEICFSFRKV